MSQVPISVYLITKNEANRIGCAIRSVIDWADEVVLVDSGSEDATVEIARSLGARVLHRDWDGYGPQKHFAENACRNDWVLNLDADEEVTPALASEIQQAVDAAGPDQAAFLMKITDVLPGETEPSTFAYSYHVLRLYHRARGSMSTHAYQDRVEIHSGNTSSLKARILHRSFVSWETTVSKLNFYSTQVGRSRAASGKTPSTARIWFEFPATFLKIWIVRRMIFRGTMGLSISLTIAYLNLLRLLKTREAAGISADDHPASDQTDASKGSGGRQAA
ncbi:MAG: glycosyltransferase family 2 protein [Planctomycetaceae bacterium]|nr:glycosyltransferase family 2 protein [Planctomycetaceae bacterium]